MDSFSRDLLRLIREHATSALEADIAPWLQPCEQADPSEPGGRLLVCTRREREPIEVPRGHAIQMIHGFVRSGVVQKTTDGSLHLLPFATLPVEDLLTLRELFLSMRVLHFFERPSVFYAVPKSRAP